ncbi:hypothetical protein OBBRIDRAFT_109353 [Obba rivulosa]|uniref:Uncharacterized protein n=1 Tax=Obba rivulosa TaxID=1052685 RepID=A0A8E2DMK6_9APHY|nr:hypothetical protein OBBRIDRAFT_109353 [Obba rivulosa]
MLARFGAQRRAREHLNARRDTFRPGTCLPRVQDLERSLLCFFSAEFPNEYISSDPTYRIGLTYLNVLGTNVVYLHSAEAAKELLVTCGTIYNDRPPLVMVTELCGYEPGPFRSYGEKLCRQRSLMEQALGPANVPTFQPLFEAEIRGLSYRLLTYPKDYDRHISRYTGAVHLLVIYGHTVTSNNDELLALGKRSLELLTNEVTPAPSKCIWAVDVFPSLKRIPDWFPFTRFKRKATDWRAQLLELYDRPV